MIWRRTWRADPRCRALADRHYTRQSIGAAQFVPPGRCLVLHAYGDKGDALWVTSWPFPEYVKHAWAGAWVCTLFRNEGAGLSSDLVHQAVAATHWDFGPPPELGFITFIQPEKIASENPGYCFKKAGWRSDGMTIGGLICLRLDRERIAPPIAPILSQGRLELEDA